jgi:N-acetylneuraminic acid mutarotase
MVAREKAAYAVMNGKLFVFGGLDGDGNALANGAIYDPETDSWTMLPSGANAPSPRQLATAVWTGLRVFIVGGQDAGTTLAYSDGARFNTTDGWLSVGTLTTGRVAPYAAAASDYLLLWGGFSASGAPLSGGERYAFGGTYYPSNWMALSSAPGSPDKATDSAWASSDSGAFIFGGRLSGITKTNKAYTFAFAGGSWTQLATGPTARWGAFAVHDGDAYYVWGGRDDNGSLSDGYRYLSSWTTLGVVGAPAARWAPHRRTGWAFAFGTDQIAILGGMDANGSPLTDGGRFDRATDTWTPIASWPSKEAHEYGVAALLGTELFVWGGRNGAIVTATGERYLP